MKRAIAVGRRGIRKGAGGPFGAVIVKKGRVIAEAHNTVLSSKDATCHAEVNAIRIASKKVKNHILSDCEIYSTTEPCPMCFSAIHWARIQKVYFGTTIDDVAKLGFNEMPLKNTELKKRAKSAVKIKGSVLRGECLKFLKDWESLEDRVIY